MPDPSTPQKRVAPPVLTGEDLVDDELDSWEDLENFELARTPVKDSPATPSSPVPLKIYESSYLLQFRDQPPNPKIKSFFPDPVPKEKDKKDEISEKKKDTKEKENKRGKPKPNDSRPGNFGEDRKPEIRERPFAHLAVTNDQRPIFLDPELPPPANPFFMPLQVGARPMFGVQIAQRPFGTAPQPPVQPTLTKNQHKALSKLDHRTANPYRVVPPKKPTDTTVKAARGILNKITPEKYEDLIQQLWVALSDFNIHDGNDDLAMTVLDEVIGLVFEKAMNEPNFSSMYADVARDLCTLATKTVEERGGDTTPLLYFRKMLLDRCQSQFELRLTCEDPKMAEKHKKRGIGNIKFIAELFKRDLLSEKIMHDVIKFLLLGPSPHTQGYVPSSEEIEVLCKLWATAGQKLDRPEAADYFEYYFGIMTEHSQSFPEARIRFLLVNIIELRSNKWIPRREEEKAKPLTEKTNSNLPAEDIIKRSKLIKQESTNNRSFNESSNPALSVRNPEVTAILQRPKGPTSPAQPQTVPSAPGAYLTSGSTPANALEAALVKGRSQKMKKEAAKAAAKGAKSIPSQASSTPSPKQELLTCEEMDTKVQWLIGEFCETHNTSEFLQCMQELGSHNHSLFISRSVYRVIEGNKLQEERCMLACMMDVFYRSAEDKPTTQQRLSSLHKGFALAIKDVMDFELWNDSPGLWRNTSELLLEIFAKGTLPLHFANQLFPPEFYTTGHDQAIKFVADFLSLIRSKDVEWILCTSFYRILQLLPRQAIPNLLDLLESKGLVTTDITIHIYSTLSLRKPLETLAEQLQKKIDQQIIQNYQQVVCEKVSSGFFYYLASNVSSPEYLQKSEQELSNWERTCLASFSSILRPFMASGDTMKEVQMQVVILNELHKTCCLFKFPKGHIGRMFRHLYECNVCSHFAYSDWSGTDFGVPDKGKAIFEVNTFLQWLVTQHKEEDED